MKLSDKLEALIEKPWPNVHLVKKYRDLLSDMSKFEIEAHGPSQPDDSNVVKRRVQVTGASLRSASTNYSQGKWLFKLGAYASLESNEPVNVLELGTCVGISAMYLMCGISCGKGGHITTLEGSPELAKIARGHIDSFIQESGIKNVTYEVLVGPIDVNLYEWINKLQHPLHLAFIDGNHQKMPTINYHEALQQLMSDKGVIVHDDISWGQGMKEAWQAILAMEPDSAKLEFYLGGKPSRGVIFRGESSTIQSDIIHFDGGLERMARQLKATVKRKVT